MGLLRDFLESRMKSPHKWYREVHGSRKYVSESKTYSSPGVNLTIEKARQNLIEARGR